MGTSVVEKSQPEKEAASLRKQVARLKADLLRYESQLNLSHSQQDKNQKFLDFAGVIVIAIGKNKRVQYINKYGSELLGYKPQEIIGKNWFDNFIPPKIRKELKSLFAELVKGKQGSFGYYENPVVLKNGKEKVIYWHNSLLYDEDGLITGSLSSGIDITELKHTQVMLQKQLDFASRLAETSPAGIILVNASGKIVFANAEVERVLGLPRDKITKLSYDDIQWHVTDYSGNYIPSDQMPLNLSIHDGKPAYNIRAIEWPDGRRNYLSVSAMPLFDSSGNLDGVISTIVDITEQMKTSARIKYQADVLANVNDAVHATDKDLVLNYWNKASENMYGWKGEEVIGRNTYDVFKSQYIGIERHKVIDLVKKTGFFEGEAIRHRKDGDTVHIETRIQAITDEFGQFNGYVSIDHDVTEREKAEEIIRTQRDLSRALASTSDFNTAIELCLETAIKVSGLDCGGIHLVDSKTDELRMVACQGISDEMIKLVSRYDNDSIVYKLIKSKKPVYTTHSELGIKLDPIRKKEGIKALMFFPIVYQNNVIACLSLASHKLNDIAREYRDAIEAVAAEVGGAVARIQTEEALKKSEEMYRILVENAVEAIIVAQDGMLKFLNHEAVKIVGYPRETMLSKPFTDFIHIEDRSMVAERYSGRLQGDQSIPSKYPFRIIDNAGRVKWIELNSVLIEWEGRPAILGFITDITERLRAQHELNFRIMLEGMISSISTSFINLPTNEIDTMIGNTLRSIGEFMSIDRGLIFQFSEDGETFSTTHEWVGDGIKPLSNKLQNLPTSTYQWLIEQCQKFKVFDLARLPDLPAERYLIKEAMEEYGVKSLLVTPLVQAGTIFGLYSLNTESSEHAWSPEEISLMQSVGQILTSALYRKRVEMAQRSQLNFLQQVIDTTPTPIFIVGKNELYLGCNKSHESFTGLNRDKIIGKSLYDVAQPESAELFGRMNQELLRTPGIHIYEGLVPDAGGKIHNVIFSKATYLDSENNAVGIVCVITDVTESKKAQESITESEKKYRNIFENAVEGIYQSTIEGRFLNVNPAFARMCGYERPAQMIKEVSNIQQQLYVHPEDRERFLHLIGEEGEVKNFEVEFKRRNGKIFWARLNSRVMKSTEGRIIGYEGMAEDITERKNAEEELKKSETKYQNLVESTHVGIASADLTAKLTHVNNALCRMLGYKREELTGKRFGSFIYVGDIAKLMTLFLRSFTNEDEAIDVEFRAIRKDGSIIDLLASVSRIKVNDKTIGFTAVMSDMSERMRLEREKNEMEQRAHLTSRLAAVGEMAAGIAHEINNPLTGVIGYAQILLESDASPEIKKDLMVINEGAQRVANIVRRLLIFARQHKAHKICVNINEIIDNTIQLQAYTLENSNIKVNMELDPQLPLTVADAGQLQQVFLNLIINAQIEMKLAHDGGNLWIKTEEKEGGIRVSFKDDGPGIALENLDRIFEPFFTTREVGQGTGLGLSVCHGIIADHNGRIWAESGVGQGATFIVQLPITIEMEALVTPPVETHIPRQEKIKANILAVDDEPLITNLISRALCPQGYNVDMVDNAADAMKMIENNRYHLILLDIKMPDMSGIELYYQLSKIAGSLARRIIFITGDVIGLETQQFLTETNAPVITKPFDAGKLQEVVDKALNPE